MLLASSGWRPGVLLNVLQRTEQFLTTTRNPPIPNVNSVKTEKACSVLSLGDIMCTHGLPGYSHAGITQMLSLFLKETEKAEAQSHMPHGL